MVSKTDEIVPHGDGGLNLVQDGLTYTRPHTFIMLPACLHVCACAGA